MHLPRAVAAPRDARNAQAAGKHQYTTPFIVHAARQSIRIDDGSNRPCIGRETAAAFVPVKPAASSIRTTPTVRQPRLRRPDQRPPIRFASTDSVRNSGSNASADVLPKPSTSPLSAVSARIEKPDSGYGTMP